MSQLGKLLEQLDPRAQVYFFKRLKKRAPRVSNILLRSTMDL